MALNLKMPEAQDLRPRITVFGVGGAGGNAVNNMIDKNLEGAEFVVANTDAQALAQSRAQRRIQLGVGTTSGLGAGARPEVGSSAAEESIDEIVDNLTGSHMCFITAGMGGGTGTGAGPIIARTARELGVLTVGVVTKPFQFEGTKRMRVAEAGVDELQQYVDTLIIIPNQNLFRIANERTTFAEAFMLADDVLFQGVKGVTDLMVRPGLINLDFADVRSVMDEMGKAMMGTGEAEGETRAVDAAEKAIANPLLDEISLKGARGVLINITGGNDLTLFELDEAANRIRAEVDQDANIIVGSTLDPELEGGMRVSVVATGIDAREGQVAGDLPTRETGKAPVVAPAPIEPERTAEPVVETPREAPEPVRPAFEPAPEFELDEGSLTPPATPEKETVSPFARDGAFIAPVADSGEGHEAEAETGFRLEPEPEADPRAAPQIEPAARTRPEPAGDSQRFGINSLIHRMTGAARGREDLEEEGEPAADARQAEDDLRVEIPAFLRRQAN